MLRGGLLTVFANCKRELFDRSEAAHDVYFERNIQQQRINIVSCKDSGYNKDWNVEQRRYPSSTGPLYYGEIPKERLLSPRRFRLPIRLPPAISLLTV